MTGKPNNGVTVIIPTWRRARLLEETLQRILACEPPPEEILIHIDAEDGETPAMLRDRFSGSRVRWFASASTQGPGGGRNLLVAEAASPILVSLDDDSWPLDADFFSRVRLWMDKLPDAGALSTMVSVKDHECLPSSESVHEVSSFVNCGVAYRREALLGTAGFLPLRYAYGMEESDLALRLMDAGWKIYQCHALRVRHDTDFAHHREKWVNAYHISNIALLAFLRFPLVLWPYALIQVMNRTAFSIRMGRWRGIASGLLMIPTHCWRHRRKRQTVSLPTVRGSIRLGRLDQAAKERAKEAFLCQAAAECMAGGAAVSSGHGDGREHHGRKPVAAETPLRFSIMITTLNRLEDLKRTLAVVGRLQPPPHEVWVVADGCSDGTGPWVKAHCPDVHLIEHPASLGSVASRAEVMERVTGDLVLALDDDSYPEQRDCLAALSLLFVRLPTLAIATFPQRTDEYPESLTQNDFGEPRKVRSFPNSGACLRVSTYRRLPGFDPMFFHMYEEPDYALQCVGNGWDVLLYPGIVIRHHYSGRERSEMRNHHRHSRNEFWSALMRCPVPQVFGLIGYRMVSQARYAAGRGGSWLIREPHWWLQAFRGIPRALAKRRALRWAGYRRWLSYGKEPADLPVRQIGGGETSSGMSTSNFQP